MNVITEQVAARVRRDFRGDQVDEVLGWLAGAWSDNQDVERVLAAVVLAAAGDVSVVRQQVRELRVDWPEVLDREFGPAG